MNLQLIRNKNYIILLCGQVISELGNSFTQVALLWFIYTTTKSPLHMGTFLSIQFACSAISRLFVGVLLDTYNKKTLIIIAEFVRGSVMILIPLFYHLSILSLWIIYICAGILGIASVMFEPALDIIIPIIVKKEDIIKANSVLTSFNQLLSILGPIIAGVITAFMGASISMLIDGVTFYISAYSIFNIKIDEVLDGHGNNKNKNNNIIKFFIESLSIFREYKILYSLLLKFSLINIGLAPIYILVPVFTEKVLKLDSRAIGFIFSSLSFGLFVGSLLPSYFKVIRKFKALTILSGFSTISIGFAILGFSRNLYQSMFGIFIVGLSITPIQIVNSAVWQTLVKTEMKGRVFAIRRLITRTLDPLSIMIFSIILGYIGVNTIFLIISIIILSALIWSLMSSNIRNLDSIMDVNCTPSSTVNRYI